MPTIAGVRVIAEAQYGAGEIAYALEDGAFILQDGGPFSTTRRYNRAEVEAIASRDGLRLCDGWPVHDLAGGQDDARIVLAQRILARLHKADARAAWHHIG